ncbi:MAG: hypothetical protein GXZ11_05475 [Tissierellia bacterium]|nr:hypothetical protein [Tissierellia bacterium]
MEKVQSQVSFEEVKRYILAEENVNRDAISRETKQQNAALLLGIKVYEGADKLVSASYKSLYIPIKNGIPLSVLELDDLLLPRKNGFWKINVASSTYDNGDTIIRFGPLNENNNSSNSDNLETEMSQTKWNSVIMKNGEIIFLGNDFISATERDEDGYEIVGIYPLDNLAAKQRTQLSDLVADGKVKFLQAENIALPDSIAPLGEDENITLYRDKGFWNIFGKRVIMLGDGQSQVYDFPINIAVPRDMVKYDRSILPWSEIKLILPQTIDAFFSPNQDILIILTKEGLEIYSTHNRKINKEPLAMIPISNRAEIVMAEWAIDSSVERWGQEVGRQLPKNLLEVQ